MVDLICKYCRCSVGYRVRLRSNVRVVLKVVFIVVARLILKLLVTRLTSCIRMR